MDDPLETQEMTEDEEPEIQINELTLSDKEKSILYGSSEPTTIFTPRVPTEELSNLQIKEDTDYKINPRLTISDNTAEVFCLRFSPDGKFLAAGCGDGAIRVFSAQTGKLSYNLQAGSNIALPTTCIRFRPITQSSRTKNVLIASNAAGVVQHWHMTSGKCLHSLEDENNQVYAMDYNTEGSMFVTVGKDTVIRVYDEATKSASVTMSSGLGYSSKNTTGHSNRIFSAKFHPTHENIIVTGGWDNTVQIWDIREGQAIRSFFGPHICGDSLDVCNNEILTGSWRIEKQLEIWDFLSGQKIKDVAWSSDAAKSSPNQPSCMLYAAQFSKEGAGRFIGAGGSGTNEAKLFDHHKNDACVGIITGLSKGIFALDFSPDNQRFAVAGGDTSIRILDICKKGI